MFNSQDKIYNGYKRRQQIEQYFTQISTDLDNCLNIKKMMNTPLKNRAFAVSQVWVDNFNEYLINLE